MRGFLMMCVCLSLAGCFAGASQGRSTTAYVNDDGIHPRQTTTVTQTYSGSTIGGTMPIMMAGGGYGGGYGTMAGPSCVLHPDRCAVIQTATVVQPVVVGSYGSYGSGTSMVGPGGAGTYGPVDTSDLEARIERLEGSVQKLKGATKLTLRRNCTIITGTPDLIKDPAEREKIVTACKRVLSSDTNPNADAKSEEN
ncbi:MAG TPA: hypothetical protein VJ694_00490 [Patescibacteria group bacterium]|nr:hypothetical protein [Patescibacteria group bacterium]